MVVEVAPGAWYNWAVPRLAGKALSTTVPVPPSVPLAIICRYVEFAPALGFTVIIPLLVRLPDVRLSDVLFKIWRREKVEEIWSELIVNEASAETVYDADPSSTAVSESVFGMFMLSQLAALLQLPLPATHAIDCPFTEIDTAVPASKADNMVTFGRNLMIDLLWWLCVAVILLRLCETA